MVSGGRSSAEALRRTIERYGKRRTVAVFADTLTEDEDLHRFMHDVESAFDIKIERLADGRNIWELFRDQKFIGNTRVDICSRILKRDPIRSWLKTFDPKPVVVLGLDWSEPHRIERARARWKDDGYDTEYPLCNAPLMLDDDFNAALEKYNIAPPRLYAMGFGHNNCGGACVKAGQYQWKLLYQRMPERYLWHEEQERITREVIGKNVAILRKMENGVTRAMTLEEFRGRIVADEQVENDGLACTCLTE